MIDYYALRFQIEFNFRDAKQYWGLEDFMNINKTPVNNAANLSMFMVNVSAKLLAPLRLEHAECSVLDLKARYRGMKYFRETLKILPQNLILLLLIKSPNILGPLERFITKLLKSDPDNLAKVLEFVIRLIHNYEDKYVPELTELFPELAEENPIEEASSENSNPPTYAAELSENELAAHSFFSIGCLLWEGGKAENAIAAYDAAIRLRPDYAEVYNNRGNIKNGLGYRDDALDDYDEAIRLNPNFTEAYSNRGTTKSSLGNHAEALTDLNEAIRLQPDFMNAYANRGVAKLGLSNIDEARADFQAALKLTEQQGNNNLKAFVEEWLRQLNIAGEEIASDSNGESVTKQGNKKSRRGWTVEGKSEDRQGL